MSADELIPKAPSVEPSPHRLGYNDRLFANDLRGWFHRARFRWLVRELRARRLNDLDIIELGCFDAKTIEHLERAGLRVRSYLGLDANWEGGLDLGRARWQGRSGVELRACTTPDDIPTPEKRWPICICLETLEHVPLHLRTPFIARLAEVTGGLAFFSVPIERGVPFLVRRVPKLLLGAEHDEYSALDFLHCSMGRPERVAQRNGAHVGFDDRAFFRALREHFLVERVQGIFPGLPILGMNLQAAAVARPRA